MAQRLFTDHAAPAAQLPPMNPCVLHPIIHSGAADSGDLDRRVDREKLCFFPTMLAEKTSHDCTEGSPKTMVLEQKF